MAIHDARDFFFSVPVHPDDRRFLAFVEPNSERIWRWKALPFGVATAPYYASSFRFSEKIADLLRQQGHKILVYCDDWITFGDTEEECTVSARALEAMLADIGISVAPHKVRQPAQRQTWLGIELDTRLGHECFRLPGSRIEAMEEELRQFYVDHAHSSTCEPLRLAALVGRCGFMSQIVEGGRQHLRRLYDELRYAVIDWTTGDVLRCWGSEPIPLTDALWSDLDWWLLNARYVNHTNMKLGDKYVNLFLDGGTDASDWGCGGEVDIN